jgi:protein-tyrosine phosphatase
LGNICRSPSAEGVFRHYLAQAGLAESVEVDSAGTGDWHVGEPPDKRAQAAALSRGYDLSRFRGRQVSVSDFDRFDYIIAMDHANAKRLREMAPDKAANKVHLFLSFHPETDLAEVPDPYYEGGFDSVLDLIEGASAGLLQDIQRAL